MAIDKDPSIYRDRGMIGSSDELDEYGVWVKSEPEDIASAHAQATPIEEPTLPDIEDLPDLELDSTEAFDFPEPAPESKDQEENEESVPTISENEKLDFAISEGGSDSGEALPSFEDIASFETEIPPVSNEDFTELSMDDFLDVETEGSQTSSAAVEEETLDIDLDFQDSVETPQSTGVVEDFGFQIEDVTSEPKTADEKAISLETVSDFDDFLNDLSDTESEGAEAPAAQAPVAEETRESEAIEDISIDVEESEPLTTAFEPVEEAADIVLSDFETTESEQEPSVSLDTASLDIAAAESGFETSIAEEPFDDVAALSRDLAETETSEVEYPSSAPAADAGLSTQLLMRIAEELSSIKTELSSLKEELSVLRGEVKPEQAEEKSPPSSHGFFDEEDDEKIALTGDELDNILNTADFTEEAGADATADMSDEAVIDDFLMDRDDLLGGEAEAEAAQEDLTFGEVAESEPAIERIELGDEPIEEVPEELQVLQQTGVKPMTAAPEDTSYLEADDLTTTDLDLTQAVIDEPDLGGTIFEEVPVEEPSIEAIHLDLDMEEALHVESEESAEGEADFENIELTLDEFVGEAHEEGGPSAVAIKEEPLEIFEETEEAPAVEESFAEVVPEGFVVEAEETSEPVIGEAEQAEAIETVDLAEEPPTDGAQPLPVDIRQEVRTVLSYMDQLLESLPEDKIEEFAKSEYFDTYKKLFEELGLV